MSKKNKYTPRAIERRYRGWMIASWTFIAVAVVYAPLGPIGLAFGGSGISLWLTPVFSAAWIAVAVFWMKTAKATREIDYYLATEVVS